MTAVSVKFTISNEKFTAFLAAYLRQLANHQGKCKKFWHAFEKLNLEFEIKIDEDEFQIHFIDPRRNDLKIN